MGHQRKKEKRKEKKSIKFLPSFSVCLPVVVHMCECAVSLPMIEFISNPAFVRVCSGMLRVSVRRDKKEEQVI